MRTPSQDNSSTPRDPGYPGVPTITTENDMRTRIHVNQHQIKANAKDGGNRLVLTVKDYKQNRKCNEVRISNGSVIYSPDKPLACGAKVWIETEDPVEIVGEWEA